jgi:hypothetical protein
MKYLYLTLSIKRGYRDIDSHTPVSPSPQGIAALQGDLRDGRRTSCGLCTLVCCQEICTGYVFEREDEG